MSPIPILCLPYAGAGATFYRGWPAPPAGIELVPLQPAGREERYHEDPYTDLESAVADLSKLAAPYAEAGPYALFGHSFGAILAYELARALPAAGLPAPGLLVVSGSAAPGVPLGRHSAGLDDEEFVARVEQLAGYVHPALADPDLREVVLPVLRADVDLHESYRPADSEPLPVPVTVFRGAFDHLVTEEDCRGWADVSAKGCSQVEFEGGHMYLAEDPLPVLRAMAELVAARPLPERL
ncbi:thioesterase II family protein [Streptomyces violaceorubidus]|jgi:surfactin synthase thioesterase subunit|uniref:Alpha/beta fold hydrolase n=1 Tax=Streptomyces violaceorubidus TaxID=284042 RepID=A0ABV1T3U1_9ACTN